MKKYLLLLFVLLSVSSFAQSKEGQLSYNISGNLKGFNQKYILLERLTLDQATVVDSIPYKDNGKFSFIGIVTEPGLYRVRTGRSLATTVLTVVSEKHNNIKIDADSTTMGNYTYSISGSLPSIQVKNILHEAVSRYKVLNEMSNKAGEQSTLSEDEKKKLVEQINVLALTNRDYIYNYIDTIHNSVIAIFSTVSFLNPDQDSKEWEKVEARLQKENDTYPLAKEYIDRVELQKKYKNETTPELHYKVGDVLPDIQLKDTSGKVISLSSLRGQYVLVDFWASWCGPCRAENPNVVSAYKQFHSKGFTVYSVSLDNDKNRWEKAIFADHLVWSTHVSELRGWSSAVCSQFGIASIPNNFLIDKEGKVIAIGLRGEALTSQLNKLMK